MIELLLGKDNFDIHLISFSLSSLSVCLSVSLSLLLLSFSRAIRKGQFGYHIERQNRKKCGPPGGTDTLVFSNSKQFYDGRAKTAAVIDASGKAVEGEINTVQKL